MTPIVEELAALRAMDVDALVARYETLYGRPPRARHREHLFRKCAFKIQERAFGGLSTVARRKLDALAAQIELPTGTEPAPAPPRKNGDIPVGTVLVREWRGQRFEVRVRDDGFEYAGVAHRSLSAAAHAITGAHWSGALFFGLRQRSRA